MYLFEVAVPNHQHAEIALVTLTWVTPLELSNYLGGTAIIAVLALMVAIVSVAVMVPKLTKSKDISISSNGDSFNFEVWAKEVRPQLLAAIQRREKTKKYIVEENNLSHNLRR